MNTKQFDTFDQNFLSHTYGAESKNFGMIILKIASGCNLDCKYCYWFRDQSVYQLPAVMKIETINQMIERVREHLEGCDQPSLKIVFHGGEPLLLKKKIFRYVCESLNGIDSSTTIQYGITTNGVLIDDEWCSIFKRFKIGVAVSIDGDQNQHDLNRVDLKGKPTYDKVRKGLRCLQRNRVRFVSLLSVYSPKLSAKELADHFINDIGVKKFDVLIPDLNHDDTTSSSDTAIADFYIELFDIWIEKYWQQGVRIRILESLVRAITLNRTYLPGVGVCPVKVACITSSGDIESYDAFRINGHDEVKTGLNINNFPIKNIFESCTWLKHLKNSLSIPNMCQNCEVKSYCRGGNVIHRYSKKNGYDNPSIYCSNLKKLYIHALSKKSKLRSIGMCASID